MMTTTIYLKDYLDDRRMALAPSVQIPPILDQWSADGLSDVNVNVDNLKVITNHFMTDLLRQSVKVGLHVTLISDTKQLQIAEAVKYATEYPDGMPEMTPMEWDAATRP